LTAAASVEAATAGGDHKPLTKAGIDQRRNRGRNNRGTGRNCENVIWLLHMERMMMALSVDCLNIECV